ncbi:hypothetical protein [Planctopirus hydrillae]|uniref:Uncharacterized protein n=1 Tax=Planctopirus hydrillae TaxID=1841610 RepID=A0A1C3EBW3_9PLAN|nr:hypothetical protein [Planctopirus hydrillae]ODA30729.1 hypothetical protein A6X21_05445 [Planctopirus hydrillae]
MSRSGYRAFSLLALAACSVVCGLPESAQAQLTRNWWTRSQMACPSCSLASPHKHSQTPAYFHSSSMIPTTEVQAPGCDCQSVGEWPSAGPFTPQYPSSPGVLPPEYHQQGLPDIHYQSTDLIPQPSLPQSPLPQGPLPPSQRPQGQPVDPAAIAPLPVDLTLIPPSPAAKVSTRPVGTSAPSTSSFEPPPPWQPALPPEPRIVRNPKSGPVPTTPVRSSAVLDLPVMNILPEKTGPITVQPSKADSQITELPTITVPAP